MVAPKDTFYLHVFVVLLLVIAACLFFGLYPKKSRKAGIKAWAIGDYYQELNRQIYDAKTFEQADRLRGAVDGFYTKEFQGNPNACMRRALRSSLTVSFDRRIKELTSLV